MSAEFAAVAPVAFTQVLLVAQQVGVPPEAIERLLPSAAPEAWESRQPAIGVLDSLFADAK